MRDETERRTTLGGNDGAIDALDLNFSRTWYDGQRSRHWSIADRIGQQSRSLAGLRAAGTDDELRTTRGGRRTGSSLFESAPMGQNVKGLQLQFLVGP